MVRDRVVSSKRIFIGSGCYYQGHASNVWSVEEALKLIEEIKTADGVVIDSCPYAIRINVGGKIIQIGEDDSDIGCSDILSKDLATTLGDYNTFVCVSGIISGCSVLDMRLPERLRAIKEAGLDAMTRLLLSLQTKRRHAAADVENVSESRGIS